MATRPSWDAYFMQIAELTAKRSTCIRRKVGAVAVKNNKMLTTGYNGAPKKVEHCDSRGCYRQVNNIPSGSELAKCWAVHAEQNVIIQAAEQAVNLYGATLYSTVFPCSICAKMIINAGIQEVVVPDLNYPDELSLEIFKSSDVLVGRTEDPRSIFKEEMIDELS